MSATALRIDWADLDLFGHVNNVAFFKYIQAARIDFCESAGLTSLNNNNQLSFMVASSQCRFLKPLLYPGEVTIHARCDWMKNSSFQLSYKIMKQGDLYAEGQDVLVVFDHHLKTKAGIPAGLRQKVEDLNNS